MTDSRNEWKGHSRYSYDEVVLDGHEIIKGAGPNDDHL